MKYLKSFDKTNENVFFGLGALVGLISVFTFMLVIQPRMPFLSSNFFKNIIRWIKMSHVLRKYKRLIIKLNDIFKDDPKIKYHYNSIKKIGDNTPSYMNQTDPLYHMENFKRYIESKIPEEDMPEFDRLLSEMREEIRSIGFDIYGDRVY